MIPPNIVLAVWLALKTDRRYSRLDRQVAAAIVRERLPRTDRQIAALAQGLRCRPDAIQKSIARLRANLTGGAA